MKTSFTISVGCATADDQIIKTDPANILIRALQLKKSKAEKEKEQVRKAAKGKAADKNKR